MELIFKNKYALVLLTILIAVSTLNLSEAGKHRKHTKHYRYTQIPAVDRYVTRLRYILGLSDIQVTHLQAAIDLKKAQRTSEERRDAAEAVKMAASAQIFSSFTYTESIRVLNELKSRDAAELAALQAAFLESLTEEQRLLLNNVRRRHRLKF